MPQPSGPSSLDAPARLMLRNPLLTDEEQVLAAQSELAKDGFNFALSYPDHTWEQYLDKVERDRAGVDLSPGRVPATMLFAAVGNQIVGRVHIRHELTPALLEEGGHIGYCVRPGNRRRGYATEMLRQGLEAARNLGIVRALVTCDDDNSGSIGTIERCGGVLEGAVTVEGSAPKRRYWIDLN
ncbi:GNAT family N-acetyltransferase [Arthrobacter tumbae]|uniref:GNAT family N-acetyltransferase n=1 Tax=Arthrobacter tumbae TaxID=163874 RepID=UPI001EF94CF5|nr:GNAT family N-acetyltransferase [Arthrobacter tumbae]MBM7782121.1 putative acetyltransferase [Arthrobacter tumbae]